MSLLDLLGNPHIRFVAIDADDTLWSDSRYFRQLEASLISMCDRAGVDGAGVVKLVRRTAKDSGPGERAYLDAMSRVVTEIGLPANNTLTIIEQIKHFPEHPIDLLPNVKEALDLLRSHHRLVLITKGVKTAQLAKLSRSGLQAMFGRVFVVSSKGKEQFAVILSELQAEGREVLMIGNSVTDDIVAADANGASTVWLNHEENLHGRNGTTPRATCEIAGWPEIVGAISHLVATNK